MIHALLVAIGGIRVALALAAGEPFHAEATLAALAVVAGWRGLR